MTSFVSELRRRNVIRVGIAYLAVAWLVLQVAEMLLPVYGFTDAAIRNLVAILAVGLLVTVVLSWAFEWTPKGIAKDSGVDPSVPASGKDNKRLDRFIIFVLIIAVAFFSVDKFVLDPARDARDIEAATEKGRADALLNIKNDKSVAVLPFANRSARDDDVYFVDGIHDDILTQLARIRSLAVTSRTSVGQYRGTSKTMKEIGAALGVRAILEGGVQRAGDRVRINVQLIDAASDDHLWAETYDRELSAANVFAVQAEIASAVADALRATLLPEEESAMQETPTESLQAYDLYLLGRFHWNKRTKESIDLARGHFEEAIEKDPNYVLALSGLADSYTMLVTYGNMTGEVAYPMAQQAIDQAMAIDDSVSEVWSSLGFLRREQRKLGESEEAFLRALDLDDGNFSAWLWYGSTLLRNRRDTEALSALQKALDLEPMSYYANLQLAYQYDMIGDFSRAIQHYDRADQLDDRDTSGFQIEIAWSLFWAGEYARAIEAHRNILVKEPDSVGTLAGLALTYLSMGDTSEAKRWDDRAAAIASQYREGYRILEAQQDYAGAIVYLEETLRLLSPRRNVGVLQNLFRNSFRNGDVVSARAYLAEIIDDLGGRIEVHPRGLLPWPHLETAAFWIMHGRAERSEPQRGRELAEEVHASLTAMAEMGWHRPGMLAALAAANTLLGNAPAAIARLNEAIDEGFQNQQLSLDNPAFDAIRDTPEFLLALERMERLIEDDKTRLANMELAPYVPPAKYEPIAVARETLRNYEGWYSDGNGMSHIFVAEDGRFMATWGPDLVYPLLAIAEDRFYTPANSELTAQFFLDEQGDATHYILKSAYGDYRMKRVDDPPPVIELPRDVLARYEGTFAHDRMSGLQGERTAADYWVAEIYVDEAGKVWIDYDNQPKLELAAYSETEFQLVHMEAQYRFVIDPDTGEYNEFIRLADGAEMHFYRQ